MKQNQIQFIYFDVGGVALLDFSKTNKWDEMLNDLNIPDSLKNQFNALFDSHEEKICIGEDINTFVDEARSKLGINFPPNYDMIADFVNRFEKNIPMLNLLEQLKLDFKLGLITAQYPRMLNMIFEKGLLSTDIWSVIIDSSIEGVTKPNPEIYHLAEKRANVEKESILFVDNKAGLLEYPKSRGWKVFEYDPANTKDSTDTLEQFIYKT